MGKPSGLHRHCLGCCRCRDCAMGRTAKDVEIGIETPIVALLRQRQGGWRGSLLSVSQRTNKNISLSHRPGLEDETPLYVVALGCAEQACRESSEQS